jgi:hypothetical protein
MRQHHYAYRQPNKMWVQIWNGDDETYWRVSTIERAKFLNRADPMAYYAGDIAQDSEKYWTQAYDKPVTMSEAAQAISLPTQAKCRTLPVLRGAFLPDEWTPPIPEPRPKKFKIIHGH